MFQLSIKNHKDFKFDLQWEELLQSQLGANVHPNRQQGFYLARYALRELLEEMNIKFHIKDLELEGFDRLIKLPQFTLSLTHTKDWAAAVLGPRSEYISLGIDLESRQRSISTLISSRIAHPQDIELDPLMVWVLKEAVFKALMNTRSFAKNIEFSSIELRDKTWHHPSGWHGQWEVHHHPELLIAIAWPRI
jgi:4'-phosphopantetheinyl transferase EntD